MTFNLCKAMKKSLFTLSAAFLALVACNKEISEVPIIEEPQVIEPESAVLTFTSERPQIEVDTKTAWDSGSSSIVWSTGDRIRVGYTLDGTWMAAAGAADLSSDPKVPAKFYSSNNVSIDAEHANSGTFTVPGNYTNSPSGSAVFYGIYPSTCTDTDSNYAPSLTVVIPTSQTPGANTFDKSADIMVGSTEAVTLSGSFPGTPLALEWNRIVAHADITFKNLAISGDTEVDKITLAFNSEAKVVGTIYLNVTDGTVTTTGSTTNQIEIEGDNLSISGSTIEAWACVLPVAFTSVDVTVKTDVATYTRSITGISKTFKKNARNTLGINMASATRTLNTNLIDNGNYVLAAKSGSTYYAISSSANGSSARRDRTEITTDGFDPDNYSAGSPYTAANNLIWTLSNVTGGVKINLVGDTDSYMQYGSNTLPLGSTGATFAVAEGTETGTFTFANSSKYISMNDTYGFGCYSSGSYIKDIYVIPATGTPTITFAETSKNVAADATSVTFTYSTVFLASSPTVTVTSDAGSAVSSTAISDGTLTVNLNTNSTSSPKTVTLTVSATGASDVVLTIMQAGVVPDASNGDVLWAEAFTGFSNNAVPSASNASTTVYGSGSVTYACTDGGSTTKIYGSDNTAGGTAPELLISKTNGAFAVTGIPTGNATSMTLSFKSNNGCTVSSSTTGFSLGTNLGTGKNYIYEVTVTSGTTSLDLTFSNSTGSNTRIDDISLVAGAPVPGITVTTAAATSTASAEGTTATLNGSLTLVNGAANANVTSAGFYYKLSASGSYTKVTCASAPTSTTSFSYDLTGLTKDSEYTYYAWAIYDSGDEVTGATTTFTPTQSGGSTTVDVTISSYATSNSWSTGTQYTSVNLDDVIKASKNGTGTNSGKYYTTSPAGWRFYQSENTTCTFVISASGGHTIESVTVEYNINNTGTLVYSSSNIASGTKVDVNASSIAFTVGNTSTATNGQVAISKITVKYN